MSITEDRLGLVIYACERGEERSGEEESSIKKAAAQPLAKIYKYAINLEHIHFFLNLERELKELLKDY